MADTPKTLSDVKALLEEAVQVVSDLETSSAQTGEVNTPTADSTEDPDDQAVDADKAQLASDEAKDEADDASEPAETDLPAAPTS